MQNKSNVYEIIKVGIILFFITMIAAFILAVVNSRTAPIIEQNTKAKLDLAMQSVLPAASDFTQSDLESVYIGKDANGIVKGLCVSVAPNGYGGAINMVVGIDTDKKVTGIDIISQSETAGLGSNAVKPEFKDQFINKKSGVSVVKSGAKENQINAISSATITSKAVTNGVNQALTLASEQLDQGGIK